MSVKKPSKKVVTQDSSMDAAMSELTRQTDALLGKAETPQPKPLLPKKNSLSHRKGHSFDIIQTHRGSRPLQSVLKTAPSKSAQPAHKESANSAQVAELSDPDELLLPAHSSSTTVTLHGGRLADVAPSEADRVKTTNEPEPVVSRTAFPTIKPQTVFFQDEVQKSENPAEALKSKSVDTQGSDNNVVAEGESANQPELPSYSSGELYATSSAGAIQPSGYTTPVDQKAPSVFDTEEYHATLHDWSKLENHGHSKWLFLLLLVVIAAASLYFIISGQKLPF